MTRKEIRYKGKDVTISYNPDRCIHVGECVRGLGQVFDNGKEPWIQPDNATVEDVAEVIRRCPTGALKFTRKDGGEAEKPDAVNRISVSGNGPLYARGRIQIHHADGSVLLNETRVAFCRCGATKTPPYCDGSHEQISFSASGNKPPACPASGEGIQHGGTLCITPVENGPLLLEGPVSIHAVDGECIFQGAKVALCRCGASAMKPFCDGAHARIGFKSK